MKLSQMFVFWLGFTCAILWRCRWAICAIAVVGLFIKANQ